MLLLSLLSACTGPADKESAEPSDPPFGMILKQDHQLYAGISRVDITPELKETYTDLNGNHQFDGCINEPRGPESGRVGCDEPFVDANGNGNFDAIWIAGYGNLRAALGVHDPITVTALVLSMDGEYVAIAGIDEVGVLESRIRKGRVLLDEAGFDMNRVVVSSSHSHQSPDVVGIWGDEANLITGVNQEYVDTIPPAIYDAVSVAAGSMVPVTVTYGAENLSDVDSDFTGEPFGGTNPDPWVVGTLNDIRDPIIANEQLMAIALDQADGTRLGTLVNFSGHPEVVGDANSELSADYVYYLRDWVERQHGGTTLFVSGSLGGMQSALGGTLPKVDGTTGERVKDEQGEQVWVTEEGWEMAETQGILLGQSVDKVATDTTPWDGISVRHADVPLPVTNQFYELAFRVGLLDTKTEDLIQNADECPGYGTNPKVFGCIPAGVWDIELGPISIATFPGELFPELFWGVPDEAAMKDESLRAEDRRWKQQDPDCVGVDYEECRNNQYVGECDCLSYHTTPYRISDDADVKPIADLLRGKYKVALGITNGYCGYIVPDPDFNTYVSALTDDGDHYEETNSCSREMTDAIQQAWLGLAK